MNDFDIHLLAAAYALDALESQEVDVFEAHLPTCSQCRSEVESFQDAAATIGSAEAISPPGQVRVAVLERISTVRQLSPIVPALVEAAEASASLIDLTERRNRRTNRLRVAVGATAAAVLIAFGVVAFSGETNNLPEEVATLIDASDANEIELSGTRDAVGNLKIVYSASESSVAIVGDGLDPLDDNQIYELWAIDSDGIRPVGLFDPQDSGAVADILATTESTSVSWAVTIEPSSGSQVPTSDPIFIS